MTLYIDTETTGLWRSDGDELVEVAVVNEDGMVVLSTLVNPSQAIPVAASAIHGITDAMVRDAPAADAIRRKVAELVKARDVVIYNASFDRQFLDLAGAKSVHCCMLRFAERYGEWNDYFADYRWQKLSTAADESAFAWPVSGPHRAEADALACRHVWRWLGIVEAAASTASHDDGKTA